MLRDQLTALLGPVVVDLGYQLWELEYAPRGGGGLLRLYIDAPPGESWGITLDDCEKVSRAVSDVLDVEDPIPGQYTLEVSSPGLDRPLRTAEHFARFAGERVKLEMAQPFEGRRRFAGQLLAVADGEITLEVEGGTVRLPIEAIHKARLVPT